MADLPQDARWYIAELIEELILGGNVRNVIHRKTRVIFADSAEDAYDKAISLSTEHEVTYLNQKHDAGQTRYWGLNELDLIASERAGDTPRTHFRRSDRLSPEQISVLMRSWQPSALPS
ncbi:MAG TPA: DUF4288 domain-containing protein [Candidatus Angelobacter sp.]|nr:DUF4288 domain-containing protein [Candidatus Angelobacter sp.]